MRQLNLPSVAIDVKSLNGKYHVFDIIRKKFIALTPEEWVRQHIIHFLYHFHHYPKGLIKVEGGLKYNKLLKRTDILVYDHSGQPYLLIECKSYDVKLSQKVIEQAAMYNKQLNARFMMISNGLAHHCFEYDQETDSFKSYHDIPPAPDK